MFMGAEGLVRTARRRIDTCHYTQKCFDNSVNDAVVPTPVPDLSDVKSVACGRFHSAATTEDGRLYTWGSCDHGVLGLGSDQSSKLLPTQVLAPSSGKARAKHYRLEGIDLIAVSTCTMCMYLSSVRA